ncbi:MAG: protein kinase, partial [Gemmatimonadota bacterium]
MEPATVHSALQVALGTRYALERELGRGGMATVYLAEDVRHHRKVAVKVLHPELSAVLGPERFLKEIELAASLQHPHILPLLDSGEGDGRPYYVMPYVDGETLRARLGRERQLPVADAVRIATEVASALDYAHRHGVIHRDVKPENVLLHDGSALVADFGIALAVEQAGGERLTQTGLSLGTPQYMAPEQAMGDKSVDARADVYALGAVTYEMLAGEPPFTGPTAQAIVARVLTEDPKAVSAQRRSVPAHVAAAVHAALEKLPADRFPSAAAFAAALAASGATVSPVTRHARESPRRPLPPRVVALLATGALAVAVALGWAAGRSRGRASVVPAAPSTGGRLVRFVIEVDSGVLGSGNWWYSPPAISPDGRTVVYAATGPAGVRLYARRIDDVVARPLEGTENGDWPFFSPDGEWVGFASRGAIRKVRLDGGTPVVVAQVPPSAGTFLGGAWGPGDTIVYTAFPSGALHRVPAAGGATLRIAVVDTTWRLMYPHPLPGGRALLVTASREWRIGRIAVLDLLTGRLRRLGPGTGARYIAGHIVYAGASGELYRQPFDLERLAPSGPAEEIASGLDVLAAIYSPFDASPSGALVYRVSRGAAQVTLMDRAGREQQVLPGLFPWSPRFAPDGRLVTYSAFPPEQESGDVWNGEAWQTDIWNTDLATGAVQ